MKTVTSVNNIEIGLSQEIDSCLPQDEYCKVTTNNHREDDEEATW